MGSFFIFVHRASIRHPGSADPIQGTAKSRRASMAPVILLLNTAQVEKNHTDDD